MKPFGSGALSSVRPLQMNYAVVAQCQYADYLVAIEYRLIVGTRHWPGYCGQHFQRLASYSRETSGSSALRMRNY